MESELGSVEIGGETKHYKRGFRQGEYTPWMSEFYGHEGELLGSAVSDYMNSKDVREALNIPDEVGGWNPCVIPITWKYHLQAEGSFWIYNVLKNQYKILVFSGDTDGAVPTYGTERWIEALNWDVKEAWKPWLIDWQVVGYKKHYDGLDFVTVHGVGHMAPQWARMEVTSMINGFIHDEDY